MLVIVFTISITPRLFLHDIFAGHVDSRHHCTSEGKSMGCIHEAVYNCQVDNNVVNTTYHFPEPANDEQILPVYIHHYSLLFSSIASSPDDVNESRGPPAVA